MKTTKILFLFLIVAAIMLAAFFIVRKQPDEAQGMRIDASNTQMVERGKKIYAQYCAACHGAQLEGQPEWRKRLPSGRLPAPPHDASGHTWHHPDAQLFDIVKHGLVPGRTAPKDYESDMPAYEGILSDAQILAVLAYIKSTWPRDLREAQDEVTREYKGR